MPDTKKTREKVRKANERLQRTKDAGFVPDKVREDLKEAIKEFDAK
jgi:hypothetical protein